MNEGVPNKFSTPEEEIAFLRQQIASRERELLSRTPEVDEADVESVAKEEIKEYVSFTPKMVLDPDYELKGEELAQSVESISTAYDPVEELVQLALEKGIRNTLTVLDKTNNAYVIDEVHRRLVEQIKSGVILSDLKEGVPPWHILHMTLYEVTMPAKSTTGEGEQSLADLAGAMEQLLSGLRTIGSAKVGNHFVFEIAVANNSDDIIFYAAVPNEFKTLFEKQTLSLFPHAVLIEQSHDYNIYVDGGHTLVADIVLKKHPIYPIKTYDAFSADPLSVILNAFSKIEREGGGAAVQFVVRHPVKSYISKYKDIIKEVEKGTKPGEAISKSTISGGIMSTVGELFSTANKNKVDAEPEKEIDTKAVELFQKKISTEMLEVNVRIAVSAKDIDRAQQILAELKSTFNQFDTTDANQIVFRDQKGIHLRHAQKAFSFREFSQKTALPLSLTELSTLIHLSGDGILATPQFKQSNSRTASAPTTMPSEGTILGINKHRGVEKPIFVSEKDRMRHFYIIGQTGTGKSVFMKNLIIQDIQAGHGVCMIDPHGTDIEDVLGAVPPEREQDVIYFDPSRLDRAMGLNMLEYNPSQPEQKTFVVNELLSIFQKLYGANPESMGPMFEQYFRNATMLVMEDPESGNTLMDIGRVMADAQFRRRKLEKATNPVVVQFWREIAGKAGGEASLENIVPYIVSKIDPLTSNDYIRPIIGQQKSAFNFRQIMDERKILLVNLSKGRLGEINANLIGMIFVGKILMAALSRVDDPTMSFPPFFLHIDEFQNVSTPAIASILSEARKYKLGLSVAHQFIAQLDPVIKDAVFGNVGSLAAFRTGPEDSQFLEQQFSPTFTANDLMNIPNYNACLRVLADGTPTPPFSIETLPPTETDHSRVSALIEQSYQKYGKPREEIEEEIRVRYQKTSATSTASPDEKLETVIMTTANQVKEYKELDLSKLKDLKLFLDSATDVYENAGEFFVVAKEENFKSLDMDDISGSEIFRTLKLKMDSLKEIVTEFREVLIQNGKNIPDERIDEVQKIYNEMIALRDIVWDTYELKDEKLDLSEPKEIVSRHDDDKQEMELIVQKANALLEKVSDTENISCHTLQKITDLFEQIKEVELGYSGNKNTLRALYEEMSEFIEEHQNDFEVVCDISLDEYVPIQKRKTMEIKPDDNEGSISIKVAKDAVDAIASKKPKEINHSLVNNNINRDEASVVAKTESVDPINVVIANKTTVEESPQRFRKESPFVNKYIKDDRYLEVIKRNYNSLAIFEKHAKNIASQIEARTLDAFERWLGESHASAFLFLKNKMLFEIEELVQARDTRKIIKEEGIKYETFVTWIDLIPEMQSVVGYEKNMKFGELFIRWIVESHI